MEHGKIQLLGEGGDNLGYIWRREVKIPVIVKLNKSLGA